MPLNTTSKLNFYTGVLNENDAETIDGGLLEDRTHLKTADETKLKLHWMWIFLFSVLHISALYGIWLMITSAKLYTILFAYFLYAVSMIGITAGVHRLWSHRSYKAKFPLRIILMIFSTIAYQRSIWRWTRDHRIHHKFTETDSDPHNSTRGFFFSHMGWLLTKKHQDVLAKEKLIDLSDLQADSVVMFQRKYYNILMPIFCYALPLFIPIYFWDESIANSWFIAVHLRHAVSLHSTFLINSAAHAWGNKPYDKNLNPAENVGVSVVAFGEGWHNYHHTFPWDYKAAELGNYRFNFATAFIDFFAKIGWAYDLKTVSPEIIRKRAQRTGDGTHNLF
ncbi:hypothetical protein DMENIID0001_120860 [Sergentomyia squamirostris]